MGFRCTAHYLIETQLDLGAPPHQDHPERKYHKKHYKVYRPREVMFTSSFEQSSAVCVFESRKRFASS